MSYKQAIVTAIQTLSKSTAQSPSPPICTAVQIRTHLQNSPQLVSTFENAIFLKCLVGGIEAGALVKSGGGYRLAEGWEKMDWRDETAQRSGGGGGGGGSSPGTGTGSGDSATTANEILVATAGGKNKANKAASSAGQTAQTRSLHSAPGQAQNYGKVSSSAQTYQQQQQLMAQIYNASSNAMFMGMPAVRATPPAPSQQQVTQANFMQLDERYANLNNQTVLEQVMQHHVARQSMGRWKNAQAAASQTPALGNSSHQAPVSRLPASTINVAHTRNNGSSNFPPSSMVHQYMEQIMNVDDEKERQKMIQLAVQLDADLNKIMKEGDPGEKGSRASPGSGGVVDRNASGSVSANSMPQGTCRSNTTADVIEIVDDDDGADEKKSKASCAQETVGKRPASQVKGTAAKKPKLHSTLPPGALAMNQQGPNGQQPIMKDQDSSWMEMAVAGSQDDKRKKKDGVSAIVEEDIFGLAGTFIKGMLNVDHDVLNQAFQGATIQKCINNTIAPGLGLPLHLLQNMNPGAWEGYVHVSSDLILRFARDIISQMTKGVRSAIKVACKEMTENHIKIMGRCRKEREGKARLSSSFTEIKATKDEESIAQLSQRVKELEKQLAQEKQNRNDQIAEIEKSHNEFLDEYEKEHSQFVLKMSHQHEQTVNALKKEIEDMKRMHNEIIEIYLDASVETVKTILQSERSSI